MELTIFKNKIRHQLHKGEMWFSIIDIIEILTDSPTPRTYWGKIKKREFQHDPIWEQLKFIAPDGKMRPTDCANTEGVLRIIMSVTSPNAEPFKLWLAQVGKERIEEINDPELGMERIRELYKAKGYPDEWIDTRLKSIDIRKQLTDEWKNRGVQEGQEYSHLTATIAKHTFGVNPSEHKALKGLDKQNLRDHMTNLELIFTMLGEEATRAIAVKKDAQGYEDNHDAAIEGGSAAGVARKHFDDTVEKVVSPKNFLDKENDLMIDLPKK